MPTKKDTSAPTTPGELWQAGLGAFTKAQAEATSKFATLATDLSTKATGQLGKLETIFEERVAKALQTLGVPSAQEVSALRAQVEALSAQVQKLSTRATPTKKRATPATPAKRAPRASK
jgi:polyhydroxyalkanoate synthesis regulator phasin